MEKEKEKLKEEKTNMKYYYSSIIPKAQEHAVRIEEEAKKVATKLEIEAKEQADLFIMESRIKAKNIIQKAFSVSKSITKDAYDLGYSISSEVFENINKIEKLKKTIQAYENTIKGYDHDFSFKENILLDELAEIYSFTEAGQNLKEAREKTKLLIESQDAAVSDYVEDNRKNTAINFIVDAFNGKVDTILSKVRSDNFSVLKQKIEDAYYLVNDLGKAFRDTKITEKYLNSRIEELKWGNIVVEIKNKEREEQRRLKEEMLEEEKARKEREKAIKEAEKEEKAIFEALENAKKDMEKATEEQKLAYEMQLKELEERLREAEEKSQRTISMAEQTKNGHVYIISNIGSFGENIYKIGMTRRLEPEERVRELSSASVPFPFDIHAMIYADNAPKLENELHQLFDKKQLNKVNPRKEFFKVSINEIKEEFERMGINAHWTLKAQAVEYRESLELEKEFQEDFSKKAAVSAN